MSKYHIKNKISKREIRKQGKNIIPLELMKIIPITHPSVQKVIKELANEISDNSIKDLVELMKNDSQRTESRRGNMPKHIVDGEDI